MADGESVGNAISGSVTGSVVQAGTIQQVVLPSARQEPLPVPRQLPPGLRDFTGRDDQVGALDTLLGDAENPVGAVAVAVLDGTGGGGKTTLAVHWAHRVQDQFPGGTLFVNLRGYGPSAPLTPETVLASFLPALGVPDSRVPVELEAQAGLYRSALAERQVLVVLDNASDPEQVRPLLPGTPGCMAVVTSRASLTELVISTAAHRISIDLFTAAESRTLLRGIIGAARADTEPVAIADLVRMCAGLPLAVRVAATRAAARPRYSLADVVADISEEHVPASGSLFGGGGDVGGAVRSVFDWSYTRLPVEQARVFRRLGLHPGAEFSGHAVAALTGLDSVGAYRCLEVLAELHLVEPAGRKRYRMHDLLHAYAAYRAELDDTLEDRKEAVWRVLAWYARTAQHADRVALPVLAGMPDDVPAVGDELGFVDRMQALGWLRGERANLVAAARHAAQHGLHDLVLALAAASRFVSLRERGLATVYVEILSMGVTAAQANEQQGVEALLHSLRGDTLWSLGRWDEATTDYVRVSALADELDDVTRRVDGLSGLGRVGLAQDRLHEAKTYYQQALPLSRGLGAGRAEAVVHANLSQICTRLGEFEQGLDHAIQELGLRRQAGDQTGEPYALHDAALAWQGMGDHEIAIGLCRQAVASYRALDDIGADLAQTILTLARSQEHAGDRAGAADTLCEALAVLTELGDPRAEQTRERIAVLRSRLAGDPHG